MFRRGAAVSIWANRGGNGNAGGQSGGSGADSVANVVKIGPNGLGILGGGVTLIPDGSAV